MPTSFPATSIPVSTYGQYQPCSPTTMTGTSNGRAGLEAAPPGTVPLADLHRDAPHPASPSIPTPRQSGWRPVFQTCRVRNRTAPQLTPTESLVLKSSDPLHLAGRTVIRDDAGRIQRGVPPCVVAASAGIGQVAPVSPAPLTARNDVFGDSLRSDGHLRPEQRIHPVPLTVHSFDIEPADTRLQDLCGAVAAAHG